MQYISGTDSYYSSQTYIALQVWAPTDRYIDWAIVRRYIDPEPSFSSADELEERSPLFMILSGWGYRKPFSITEQSGNNLTDYSICLKIGESSASTNYDFHLNGLSAKFPSGKNDGGDLRFYDGTDGLSFWVDKVDGTAPNRTAYVWVKIPYLGANQTKTLWCYFGNPNAINISNGDNIFILFDDFDTASLDTIKWISAGDYLISNSVIQINPNHSTESLWIDNKYVIDGIFSNLLFNYPIEIRTRVIGHSDDVKYWIGLVGLRYQYDDSASWRGLYLDTPQEVDSEVNDWGYDVPPNGLVGDVVVRITYNSFYLRDPSPNTPQIWNYGLKDSQSNPRIALNSWGMGDISIDFITVRKYISPEPIVTWSGDIERNSIPSPYFIVSYKQKN